MGRTAVVTGATGLLGRHVALAFFKNSYNVAINYLESEKQAKELLNLSENRIFNVRADVSNMNDVKDMANKIFMRFGNIDVLVNNAGITVDSLLIKYKEDDWDRVINVNLKGVFNCIKVFAPFMKRGGHIINISSYSGLKGREGQVAYSASKAALIGLTKTAAVEFSKNNIRVNVIAPGYMPSRMGVSAEVALKKAIRESLLEVLSDPEEVANFIIYLANTKNITGQVFCIDSRII
jgi:3-oxoacyl-[acyl-carrier protein] reductase